MHSASVLRNQIEATLAGRIPSALSPTPHAVRLAIPTGIWDLDAMLEGGFPSAAITELVGSPCSGRTTTALAYLSSVTRKGNVCAWIDVADTLDPESVAANGVDLERLLWVRCGRQHPQKPEPLPAPSTNVDPSATPNRHTGGSSMHQRSKGQDMPQAITAMLHAHGGLYDRQIRREKKIAGTPGAPNRPLTHRSEHREEQVNSDRLPPRRGDNLAIAPRCAEPQPRRPPSLPAGTRMPINFDPPKELRDSSSQPWQAVDHALRAADLLLQGGGFSALVLDLGSTPPEIAWRIPLATWFRFRAACERTRVSLLLLTQHTCARSSAELVIRLETGILEVEHRVMTGIRYQATTERNRSDENKGRVIPIRKSPRSDFGKWKSEAAWARQR